MILKPVFEPICASVLFCYCKDCFLFFLRFIVRCLSLFIRNSPNQAKDKYESNTPPRCSLITVTMYRCLPCTFDRVLVWTTVELVAYSRCYPFQMS
jgi:hypothetical protein